MSEHVTPGGNLIAELRAHLGAEQLAGLPSDWFQRAESAPAVSAAVVGDRSTYSYEELELDALGCTRCRLCETRNKVVFGVGNRNRPRIAFVGEGPGADEDRVGEPFVGKAGALLTAAITKGLGMKREDLYICNVVKCRPPGNRAPAPDEVENCSPFLFRQLELIAPEVIVTLGSPAQLTLVGNKGGISKIRGQWLEWRDIPVMPTFHPAYILRTPEAKRPFWEDLQAVLKRLSVNEGTK